MTTTHDIRVAAQLRRLARLLEIQHKFPLQTDGAAVSADEAVQYLDQIANALEARQWRQHRMAALPVSKDDLVEWDDPLGDGSEGCTSRATVADVIAFQRRREPRYQSDAEALDDFMVVHWARRVPTTKTLSLRRAPVQGYSAGIPWWLHLRAYDAYCKRWGRQDALIDLEGRSCRGGFSTGELDQFVPGWRQLVAEFDRPAPTPDAPQPRPVATEWPQVTYAAYDENGKLTRASIADRTAVYDLVPLDAPARCEGANNG